jgi:hypothetical protein
VTNFKNVNKKENKLSKKIIKTHNKFKIKETKNNLWILLQSSRDPLEVYHPNKTTQIVQKLTS